MHIRALLTIGLLFAGCAQAAQAAGGKADAAFRQVGREYIDALASQDPVLATQLGDHRRDGEFPQVGAAARVAGESTPHEPADRTAP